MPNTWNFWQVTANCHVSWASNEESESPNIYAIFVLILMLVMPEMVSLKPQFLGNICANMTTHRRFSVPNEKSR